MRQFMLGATGVAMAIGALVAGVDRDQAAVPKTLAPKPLAPPAAVVVELFTSQGCSSCPPADALLATLAAEPGIIAISRPVTYWDRLGWKDTLARPENTALQRTYAQRGGEGAGVYTPQAVIQGSIALVGSRVPTIRQAIARARVAPQPHIGVMSGAVTIDGAITGRAILSLVALAGHVDVAIGNGENGGRRIRYVNVVRAERSLGEWGGGKARFAIAPSALKVRGADRYAVILRRGDAGPIMAARFIPAS